MRTFHRVFGFHGHSRRETVGLLGAFLVFLIGLPSHSEPLIDSAKHLVQQMIQLVLVFLGLATPAGSNRVRRN